ncbi:MAG: periplasmic nitrate reductase subunit alpha, partial [Gammaproteobacteria bacterium]|nr:periplasmic nitrate reductase subunit alpha [Gammaproteobacteria bacterium]
AVNWDFVNKHTIFATGPYDIGYGMRNTDKYAYEAEKDTQAMELAKVLDANEAIAMRRKEGDVMEMKNAGSAGAHWAISFEDFKTALQPYTLDFVAQLAKGDDNESLEDFKKKLQQLADIYASDRKIVSFWTMG